MSQLHHLINAISDAQMLHAILKIETIDFLFHIYTNIYTRINNIPWMFNIQHINGLANIL